MNMAGLIVKAVAAEERSCAASWENAHELLRNLYKESIS